MSLNEPVEYKVIIEAEGMLTSIFFSGGKVNAQKTTDTLNKYARQGWRVKTMEKENRRTFLFFSREALIFVLERSLGQRGGR